MFNFPGKVYDVSQLTDFILDSIKSVQIIRKGRISYYNCPASFDIETSSFYRKNSNDEDEKVAIMYIWQFGLNGNVIYGRTWDEFIDFTEELVSQLTLSLEKRLLVYVHNLGYEFQFMRKYFTWEKVFAIKQRRPVYSITTNGIEFRCSLFLSNYALAYIGDKLLLKYKVKKLVGSLDYSLIRHSSTPLTEQELQYCINDVLVVMAYIQEKIEQDGSIIEIPLTNTGYVRKYCREQCFYQNLKIKANREKALLVYKSIMRSLTIKGNDEYRQLKRAFMGGFTHASALYANQILYNVGSADLTSSYPSTMVSDYYPMSTSTFIGEVRNAKLLQHYLSNYCCLFDIELFDIQPRVDYENFLSLSRCTTTGKVITNNGRVVSAEHLITTITELDYINLVYFYKFSSYNIYNLRIYKRGYLPKQFILSILGLYKNKTSLKGVKDKKTEYMVSKNMINASYGMMVTDIIREEYIYDNINEWSHMSIADYVSQLTNYNNNYNRFLNYAWGIWVTAHARYNLFTAIKEFGSDYVYSDTDSIKGFNFSQHQNYFNQYNANQIKKLLKMCIHYSIPFELCSPKAPDGEKKIIGLWEIESPYLRFKTCGAKRYIYEYPNHTLSLTVAGLNKKYAVPYLLAKFNNIDLSSPQFKKLQNLYIQNQYVDTSKYNTDIIFEYFGDGMFIPKGHTGKQTLTYIDEPKVGYITDYLGNMSQFSQETSIHMEPQSYYMSLIYNYIKFLEGVQYEKY